MTTIDGDVGVNDGRAQGNGFAASGHWQTKARAGKGGNTGRNDLARTGLTNDLLTTVKGCVMPNNPFIL